MASSSLLGIYSLKRPMAEFPESMRFEKCLRELGKTVLLRQRDAATGTAYTIKTVRTKYMAADQRQALDREQYQYLRLSHPNVLRLYYTYANWERQILMFEGTWDILTNDIERRRFYDEPDAKSCIRQLLSAVQYCHERRLIHRDIQPWNIFITAADWQRSVVTVKLGALEKCVEVSAHNEEQRYGIVAEHGCAAPEMLNGRPYGRPVDMWGVGLTLFWMLAGHHPFLLDLRSPALSMDISQGWFLKKSPQYLETSKDAQAFVSRLLTVCPAERPTASHALKDPWLMPDPEMEPETSSAANGSASNSVTPATASTEPKVDWELIKEEVLLSIRSLFHALDMGKWDKAKQLCASCMEAVISVGGVIKRMDLLDYILHVINAEVEELFITQLHCPTFTFLGPDAVMVTYVKTYKDRFQTQDMLVMLRCVESSLWKSQEASSWKCYHIQQSDLERVVTTASAAGQESTLDQAKTKCKSAVCGKQSAHVPEVLGPFALDLSEVMPVSLES